MKLVPCFSSPDLTVQHTVNGHLQQTLVNGFKNTDCVSSLALGLAFVATAKWAKRDNLH